MMDWATKIAAKLEVGIEGQEPEQFIAAMSAALREVARKNKAAGMREALTAILDAGKASHDRAWSAWDEADFIRAEANRIEKGE